MGMYDTFGNTQLKVGPCALDNYTEGQYVDVPDGLYLGYNGFIVIKNGIFVAEFESLQTSSGGKAFTADDLLTFNSDFYRLLYGNRTIVEKEQRVAKLVKDFKNASKIRRAKVNRAGQNGNSVSAPQTKQAATKKRAKKT